MPEAMLGIEPVLGTFICFALSGVIDVDGMNGSGFVGDHCEAGHAVCGVERQLCFGCLGKHKAAFEMLIHPQHGGDLEVGGVLMIVVRRTGDAPVAALNFGDGGR